MSQTETSQREIAINGKTYTIETSQASDGTRYILTGKRGAKYGTMRNRKNPSLMFLIDLRGFGIPAGFDGVVLTDADGSLAVANAIWLRAA